MLLPLAETRNIIRFDISSTVEIENVRTLTPRKTLQMSLQFHYRKMSAFCCKRKIVFLQIYHDAHFV